MEDKPELLSPAGSFSAAFYAYEHGADAVYLGLKSFSARSGAKNFTFDELSRLKGYAADRGKKIYVTLNTIIKENEIPSVTDILHKLAILEIDGIIIQDLGILHLLQTNFPGLPVHASTQMAVHTAEGVRTLKKEGIKRVILSRELSVSEIKELAQSGPPPELEVFIHGALCYSFSGLCLASGKLLGRSANRGECAQICRTWFKGESGRGYYFSMKDLAASGHIKTLGEIGVTSLKIEGRRKSPEYAGLTAALYRKLMDGDLSPEEWDHHAEELKTVFSRTETDAWLKGTPRSLLVDPLYPSHRGINAGRVLRTSKFSFTMETRTELSLRDGLLFFEEGSPPSPVKFGIREMRSKKGKNITHAQRGEQIQIRTSLSPSEGETLYKVSAHDLHWPEIKPERFAPWRKGIDISVSLTNTDVTVSASTSLGKITCTSPVTLEKAQKPVDFKEILEKLFKASGKSWFTCGTLIFENKSRWNDTSLFIPPSRLKKIKNEFYSRAETLVDIHRKNEGKNSSQLPQGFLTGEHTPEETGARIPRSSLVPKSHKPIPFVLFDDDFSPADLPVVNNKRYIPLMPVLFNSTDYFTRLKKIIEDNPDSFFVLGLNAIGHFEWAEYFKNNENVSFFIDYGLYIANHRTYRFFAERIPRIDFGYFWIEGSLKDYRTFSQSIQTTNGKNFPVYFIEETFSPHLFIGRSCYTSMLNGGTCPPHCTMDFTYPLTQGSRNYQVAVKDCITWLFKKD